MGKKIILSRGFTLVELLVVMAIVSVAIGLVGALGVDAVNKYKRRASQLYIEAILSDAKKKAFVMEQGLQLKMQGNQVVILNEAKQKLTAYELENVSFTQNTVDVDRFGNFKTSIFVYQYDSSPVRIDLLTVR